MEAISSLSSLSGPVGAAAPNSFSDLGSEDFLRLLIMQLRSQDPLEPVDNAELLEQISSVREIELSTTLTESLRVLTGQQRFASASSLIGKYVTGPAGADGTVERGIVAGVRFTDAGQPILQLSNGSEIPVEQVGTIESPLRAAEALMGQPVIGLDRRDPTDPQVVGGVVTGVQVDTQGEVLLELDTGEDLRFRDFVRIAATDAI